MSDNIDEIINKVKSNSGAENKKLVEGIINNLSESQSRTVQNILSDKEKRRSCTMNYNVDCVLVLGAGVRDGAPTHILQERIFRWIIS
mgnify:CR=1 FL=1